MKVLYLILDFFMILGAIPGLVFGAGIEVLFNKRLNGTLSGTLCLIFGIVIFAAFSYGLLTLLL